MRKVAGSLNPYEGSILIEGLGPILSRNEMLRSLTELPSIPAGISGAPEHIRLHWLTGIRTLHIPAEVELQVAQSIDLMVRPSYMQRDPRLVETWADISGERSRTKGPLQSYGAIVMGPSGTGKTEACYRGMNIYPQQVVDHGSFPGVVGSLKQVVWLSVEVPPSGKAGDLALALMRASDEATEEDRFARWLAKDRIAYPSVALAEWQQWAKTHFLGILHLDEVQNFFKLLSLKQRARREGKDGHAELSIVEDKALLWLLSLINSGATTVLVSGTLDGIDALSSRFSTLSRLTIAGNHVFTPFSGATDSAFLKFLPQLFEYQFMPKAVVFNGAWAEHIYKLTAGVQRFIVASWVAAHRVAFARGGDRLTMEDFTVAVDTLLAPIGPAVAALLSKDVNRLRRYEDLVGRDTLFWRTFWDQVAR